MTKKLPQPKKTLKTFILEEDAKVIDKTMTKVALTASFLAINISLGMDDANAKGHSNHSDHSNYVAHEGPTVTTAKSGDTNLFKDPDYGNNGEATVSKSYTIKDNTVNVQLEGKTLSSVHANHYNHTNGSGQGSS